MCANYGEKHSSNYRGYIKYKEELERAQEKREIKKIGIIERDMIGIAPAIQKSYAETLKNQSTLEDINKKLKKIRIRKKQTRAINYQKRQPKLCKNRRDVPNFIRNNLGSINQACDTHQELRYCIETTIKDRFGKYASSITNILNKAERNSILFPESENLIGEDPNG